VKNLNKLIDFRAIEEPWNLYKLKDDTLVKTRFILITTIFEGVDEALGPKYSINSDTVIGIIAPQSLMSKPSEKSYTLEERVDAIEQELAFEVVKEEWSKYEFDDGATFKAKPVLTKVARTSLYDSRGQPIYLVNTQPIVDISVPKELREKLKATFKK
jgi:hypothetical protein